jgi:hypothetical protein
MTEEESGVEPVRRADLASGRLRIFSANKERRWRRPQVDGKREAQLGSEQEWAYPQTPENFPP